MKRALLLNSRSSRRISVMDVVRSIWHAPVHLRNLEFSLAGPAIKKCPTFLCRLLVKHSSCKSIYSSSYLSRNCRQESGFITQPSSWRLLCENIYIFIRAQQVRRRSGTIEQNCFVLTKPCSSYLHNFNMSLSSLSVIRSPYYGFELKGCEC